jgi:hypothetical protein
MGAVIAKQLLAAQGSSPAESAGRQIADDVVRDSFPHSPDVPHTAVSDEPRASAQEHERSSKTPFVIKLTQNDRSAFTSVMNKISLANMFRAIGPLARHHEARGGTFSEAEKRIIELFDNLANNENHRSRELGDVNLQFRWVSATPKSTVDELAEKAPLYGGNPPTDSSGWVHVEKNVVEDFMANPVHSDPGVLFVYDGNRLTPITQEDKDADWKNPAGKHAYMHAQKPIPGFKLKDALVGMVIFDDPHDSARQD